MEFTVHKITDIIRVSILCIIETRHKYCVSWIPDIKNCVMDTGHKYYVSWIQDINAEHHKCPHKNWVSWMPDVNIMYNGYQTQIMLYMR